MQPALTDEEREAFKNLVVKYHAAWSPGREAFDIRNAKQFYSQKSSLSAYDIMPTKGPILGWENYKKELTHIMDGFAEFALFLTKDDVQVFRYGNIICTTSDFQIRGVLKNGQPLEGVGRTSLIWERQEDGNWLIVHEHSSTPIVR
ncbi:MAG: nuclear transport factor 2 family protein [Scytonematopsis contorta HA4267-MV1]|jgi:ketosteroid isomerase-like protein|nr:nuclear transport factor 2 family protein [Scytonematopsis contorta HA4267-MV1]